MKDPCNLVEDWVKTVLYPQQILGHPHHKAWEDKLQSPPSSWQPPPQGWLKINVDVDVRNHKVFLAAVCRDEFGKLLYAWTDSNVKGSSTWAEAHATLLAAKEASKLQLKYVILEAHSQIVINALNQVSECSTLHPDFSLEPSRETQPSEPKPFSSVLTAARPALTSG
jgi:hypothetical protein